MKKGILVFEHPDTGNLCSQEMELPINTNMATVAWALDMCRKINEHGRFRRFVLRLVLGKYAWRELIGLKESVDVEWDVEEVHPEVTTQDIQIFETNPDFERIGEYLFCKTRIIAWRKIK